MINLIINIVRNMSILSIDILRKDIKISENALLEILVIVFKL
jgi:hypothetical protein